MYSNSHINMGTSADDLFDKSGKNQNSLHYKYNKFLVSPYLPRNYNHSLIELNNNTKEFKENKENEIDDSLGETHMYYPKPNNYNSIYTQRFSKKYKDFYYNPNYIGSPTYNNFNNVYTNNPIRIRENNLNINTVKTPDYQIKKEIQYQRTPDKYNNNIQNNKNEDILYNDQNQNNKYNNYKRYDDYYSSSNKIEQRYKSPVITKIAENNFINKEFNNNNHLFSPGMPDKRWRLYYSQNFD